MCVFVASLLFANYYCCLLQDPYIVRPLPHLIGSVKFLQDDDVGIGEPESEGHKLPVIKCVPSEVICLLT